MAEELAFEQVAGDGGQLEDERFWARSENS
jgi:hypothetical protein